MTMTEHPTFVLLAYPTQEAADAASLLAARAGIPALISPLMDDGIEWLAWADQIVAMARAYQLRCQDEAVTLAALGHADLAETARCAGQGA